MPERKAQKIAYTEPWKLAHLPPDTPVLLAFSGGADSRALLHLLAGSAARDGFPLILAHVNHGIRGDEARSDRDFCERTARAYGLEICFCDADVPALAAKHGKGIEEEARNVRYAFFGSLMKSRGIPLLAAAHHADDNLETMLFRLSRGTGLRGLGGIPEIRSFAGNGFLTRPLLRETKAGILRYCGENGLEYVTDSTNTDETYARNRLRSAVLPVLEELFPLASVRAVQSAAGLREDEEFLSSLAERFLSHTLLPDGGLPVAALLGEAVPVRRRALLAWCARTGGGETESVHVGALEHLLSSQDPGERVALPGGRTACVREGILTVTRDRKPKPADPGFRIPFSTGTVRLPGGLSVTVQPCRTAPEKMTDRFSALVRIADPDAAYFRLRQEGDLLLSGGHHRKVRKLWWEAGIGVPLREKLPLLCDADGILWAPFAGVRDTAGDAGEIYLLTIHL